MRARALLSRSVRSHTAVHREGGSSMEKELVVVGWRGLSLAVGERIGRPVGVSLVRNRIENSGLPVGRKLGGVLVFDASDLDAAVRLVEQPRR